LSLRDTLKAPRAADEERHHDQVLAAVRTTLTADAFVAAWAEGRAMTLEQAVAYALDEQTPA
jgi:hypothetical protein